MSEERAGQEGEQEMNEATRAYPESPTPYESSPVEPPTLRHEGPTAGAPDTDPDYEPQSVRSAARLARIREQEQPIGDAYPEPPVAYDGSAEMLGSTAVPPPVPVVPPLAAGAAAGSERIDAGLAESGRGMPVVPQRSRAALVIGLVVLAVLVALALVFVLRRHAGASVMTGGALEATPGGLVYENAAQHIRFTAPATWTRYDSRSAQVMVRGEGCSFGLLQQRTAVAPERLAADEAAELRRRHPEAQPVVRQRPFGAREAQTFTGSYADAAGQPMTQTYLLVPRAGEMITLIETSTAQACEPAFLGIEEGMSL